VIGNSDAPRSFVPGRYEDHWAARGSGEDRPFSSIQSGIGDGCTAATRVLFPFEKCVKFAKEICNRLVFDEELDISFGAMIYHRLTSRAAGSEATGSEL
jgi:hypothetical protein